VGVPEALGVVVALGVRLADAPLGDADACVADGVAVGVLDPDPVGRGVGEAVAVVVPVPLGCATAAGGAAIAFTSESALS